MSELRIQFGSTRPKPESGTWKTRSEVDRFFSFVEITDKCWNWTGSCKHDGRGCFTLSDGRQVIASRFIFSRWMRPIRAGLDVLHKCDNPSCVRPDHLFLGTALDNSRDMVAKGRSARGSEASRSKLTSDQVDFIKKNYQRGKHGGMNTVALAKKFGVTPQSISLILKGKNWKYHE